MATKKAKVEPGSGPRSTLDGLGRELAMVSVRELRPSPLNPRGEVSDEDVAELVESVRTHGVLQPLLVRRVWVPAADETRQGRCDLEVIAGHRRLRAAQLAGLDRVQCMILSDEPVSGPEGSTLDDATVIELMLTENSARRDVAPLREADAITSLVERYGRSVAELAARTGRSERWVRQRMALTRLIPEWRAVLEADRMSLVFALRVSLYPEAGQREFYGRLGSRDYLGAGEVSLIDNRLKQLSAAGWFLDRPVGERPACSTCAKRSDAQLRLLGEDSGNQGPACLDAECWAAKFEHQRAAGKIITFSYYYATDSSELVLDRLFEDLKPSPDRSHWEDSAWNDEQEPVDETMLSDMAPDAVVWVERPFNPGLAGERMVRVEAASRALKQTPDHVVAAESVERIARTAAAMKESLARKSVSPEAARRNRIQARKFGRLDAVRSAVADRIIAPSGDKTGWWAAFAEDVDSVMYAALHACIAARKPFSVDQERLSAEIEKLRALHPCLGGYSHTEAPHGEAWQRAMIASWYRQSVAIDTNYNEPLYDALELAAASLSLDQYLLPETFAEFMQQVTAEVDAELATEAAAGAR